MSAGPTRVLLVEDNPGDARLITETLGDDRNAFQVSQADTLRQAVEVLESSNPDVILLDLGLPDSRGRESFEGLRSHTEEIPVIVLTGSDDTQLALELMKAGAQDYLVKGETGDAVLARAIRYAVERHRAERARLESEARFRAMVENLPTGLCQVDREGAFLMANPRLVEMLGVESEEDVCALHRLADVCLDPDVPDLLYDALEDSEVMAPVETEWRGADGPITVRISGRTVRDGGGEVRYFDLIVEDVTKEKRMERHLRQAHKMEAIGQLAGGVAHDFNNLLTVIEGHSAGLLDGLSLADPNRTAVEEILAAAERAAWLTRQLLTFGKRQVVQPKV
ncbi:MAG: response regulator, partial [Longimicrobiales bacterium]|nr:response regulator [Longimicrobiales bacterium]